MICPCTAAIFNIMCSFPKFGQAYCNLAMMIYTCHKTLVPSNQWKGSDLPLTTLCVQVSDPTGINDCTLCSLSITTI